DGFHDVLQQRASGQTMQHFGQAALHARALAGCHDDHVDCCHVLPSASMMTVVRLARIIVLLTLVTGLAACSAIKLGYNTLGEVAYWWLDSYIDFTDAQAPLVRQDLARLHAWHRHEELPRFIQ